MRSIREYIRKTLFDSSSILLPAINDMRRQFPPASEAFEFHGAYDAFEIYINVAPSDSGMKSYVQLASFWRGNGGVGFDVSIMPDTCFEAFVFLEAARGAGGTLARSLPVSFAFEGYVDVDERGVTTSYSGVFDRLKACGTAPSAVTATLIDYDRDKERVAQACGRVEIRRVPLAFGAQCFVWTTPLHCAADGYNLSFRSGADEFYIRSYDDGYNGAIAVSMNLNMAQRIRAFIPNTPSLFDII